MAQPGLHGMRQVPRVKTVGGLGTKILLDNIEQHLKLLMQNLI